MLGAEQAGLNAGRHALAWVLGQTDIWYLLYRCANYVSKGHGQSPSSVSILDNLFTLDEDHPEYQDEEDLNNQFVQGREYCYKQSSLFEKVGEYFTINRRRNGQSASGKIKISIRKYKNSVTLSYGSS